MKLSVITDEIDQDLATALEFAVAYGIDHVAVRSVWEQNVAAISDGTVERLGSLVRRRGLRVSAVLSPLFKCVAPDQHDRCEADPHYVGFSSSFRDHVEAAGRVRRIAEFLNAPVVRIFSFLADQPRQPMSPDGWAPIAESVAAWPSGLCAVENEHTCRVATLRELEEICTTQDVSAVIDPCNQVRVTGTVTPDDLGAALVHRAVDVHVKDVRDGRYVPAGTGLLPWPALMVRLRELRYKGYLTLESHLRGDLCGLAASIEALRGWVRS